MCLKELFLIASFILKVGAVKYEALSPKKLGHLLQHHQNSSHLEPLTRGQTFASWKYGQMRAIGSRAPQGGRPGDGYSMYSGVEGRTRQPEQEILTLFEHARV